MGGKNIILEWAVKFKRGNTKNIKSFVRYIRGTFFLKFKLELKRKEICNTKHNNYLIEISHKILNYQLSCILFH